MKKILVIAVLAAGAAITSLSPAIAAQGCGLGFTVGRTAHAGRTAALSFVVLSLLCLAGLRLAYFILAGVIGMVAGIGPTAIAITVADVVRDRIFEAAANGPTGHAVVIRIVERWIGACNEVILILTEGGSRSHSAMP